MIESLKELIIVQINNTNDVNLLDLIHKILLAES